MAARGKSTADRILDVAERLVQARGFNAFSYADIAAAVGIRKASLHHHFPAKADLGVALVERYHRRFFAALGTILDDNAAAPLRLQQYVEVYGRVLRKNRMCLCGMLASDIATLPRPVRERVSEFFVQNAAWVARVLEEGRSGRGIQFDGPAAAVAAVFVSALEGAMLVARGSGSRQHFDRVAERLLNSIRTAAGPGSGNSRRPRPRSRPPRARRASAAGRGGRRRRTLPSRTRSTRDSAGP